ncbi:MAG: hypothetical protein IPP27_13690 [Bacteroidetes bacterium]|nr:hypothetical protein [Bacteroidota bacterium]
MGKIVSIALLCEIGDVNRFEVMMNSVVTWVSTQHISIRRQIRVRGLTKRCQSVLTFVYN